MAAAHAQAADATSTTDATGASETARTKSIDPAAEQAAALPVAAFGELMSCMQQRPLGLERLAIRKDDATSATRLASLSPKFFQERERKRGGE